VPIYEYQCKKCKHKFEKIQKYSDRVIKKCPECGGPVEQLPSAPAVQFKGSGFYVTDYARKGTPGDSGSSEGASSKSTESSDSAKTDSKSEAKTEAKSETKAETKTKKSK
jgi:putative FmdB family regulatory protein